MPVKFLERSRGVPLSAQSSAKYVSQPGGHISISQRLTLFTMKDDGSPLSEKNHYSLLAAVTCHVS